MHGNTHGSVEAQIRLGCEVQEKAIADDDCSDDCARLELAITISAKHEAYKKLYEDGQPRSFSDLPIIDKSFVRENIDHFFAYCSTSADQINRYLEDFKIDGTMDEKLVFHTSGSSGEKSISVYGLDDFGRSLYALHKKTISVHNPKRVTYIGLLDRYNGGNQWMYFMRPMVDVQMMDYFGEIAGLVEGLIQYQPDVIYTKPTKLLQIGKYLKKYDLHISSIKHIVSVGENLEQQDSDEIFGCFGVRPCNSFSTTEAGPIAYQEDPLKQSLALYDSLNYVEIVDEQGNSIVEDNICGRLVVTNFYNQQFPLIRYNLADIVCWQSNGKEISFVQGRADKNLGYKHEGKQEVFNEILLWQYHMDGMRNLRIEVDEGKCIELYVVPKKGTTIEKATIVNHFNSYMKNNGVEQG